MIDFAGAETGSHKDEVSEIWPALRFRPISPSLAQPLIRREFRQVFKRAPHGSARYSRHAKEKKICLTRLKALCLLWAEALQVCSPPWIWLIQGTMSTSWRNRLPSAASWPSWTSPFRPTTAPCELSLPNWSRSAGIST